METTFDAFSLDELPDGPAFGGGPFLRTIVAVDLVEADGGERGRRSVPNPEIVDLQRQAARSALLAHNGTEIDDANGLLALFDLPSTAVQFAIAHHAAMEQVSARYRRRLTARIAIHLGEVYLRPNAPEDVIQGAKAVELDGLARSVVERLRVVALPRQTLITRSAFDIARTSSDAGPEAALKWMAHGSYLLDGLEEPIELFEAGRTQQSPLAPPPNSSLARRNVAAEDEVTLGWRASKGQSLPWRLDWILQRKLGDGGVGEVWLIEHEETAERRVIKFCYGADRLRSLKREVALFRLLQEALGHRDDIAPILSWNFDTAPPFIETAYSPEGSLEQWADAQGGLQAVPRSTRLELMAEVADALGAAHSVGVLHKDIKPPNVLVRMRPEGTPHAVLADFGIGQLSDRSVLERYHVTMIGATELLETDFVSGGTMMYMAPELLEQRMPTVQSDIYALGVMIYQTVVGDFSRALSTSWRRDIEDDILADDIALIVDGSPSRRPSSASEVARLLRTIEERRAQREEEERERERGEAQRLDEERGRVRRRRMLYALVALFIFSAAMFWQARQTMIEAARATREARRANRQARVAEQVTGYIVELLRESDPRVAQGKDKTVKAFFKDARSRVDEVGDDPLITARVKQSLAKVLEGQGLFDDAIKLQKEVVSAYASALGPEDVGVAEALIDLAMTYVNTGQHDRTEATAGRALSILAKSGEDQSDLFADALQLLGQSAFETERMAEAKQLFRQAMEIQQALGEGAELRGIEERYALCRLNLGDPGGLEDLRRSYEWRRKNLGETHLETAEVLTHLSYWLREYGETQEAGLGYKKALEVYRDIFGPDHPFVGSITGNLGWVMLQEERFEEAEPLLRRGAEIARAGWGASSWRTGAIEGRLGWALFHLGRFSEAKAYLTSASTSVCRQLGESTSACQEAQERVKLLKNRQRAP